MDEARINLTQGKVTVIDAEFYPFLSRFKWHAARHGRHSFCARRGVGQPDRSVKLVLMHRLIVGAEGAQVVDHINGDALDNRLANLRICTAKENVWNQRKKQGTSSKYRGVHFCRDLKKRPWRAVITPESGRIELGYFESQEVAALAWNEAALRFYGSFAKLNVINKKEIK